MLYGFRSLKIGFSETTTTSESVSSVLMSYCSRSHIKPFGSLSSSSSNFPLLEQELSPLSQTQPWGIYKINAK